MQQRRFVLVVCLLALTVIITAAASQTSSAKTPGGTTIPTSLSSTSTTLGPRADLVSASYRAELLPPALSDDQEPLAVLTLEYDAVSQQLSYALEMLSPLPNPSVATICQGTPGQNGNAVYTLFAGPTIAGRFSGVLCAGHMEAGSLVGTLRGATLADLVLLIEQGDAYVTIGTSAQPIDAARGQIRQ